MTGDRTVAVVGLGYVGLPLAVGFAKRHRVIGFDVDAARVEGLTKFQDRNGETTPQELREAASAGLRFTREEHDLAEADVFVITVPTPIDAAKRPDLTPLLQATRTIGRVIRGRPPGRRTPIVVYESTVYPGCTEEVCVPVLEKESGARRSVDFRVGYSPERINPGDHAHTLANVVKVVSGEDEETLDVLAALYGSVVTAGVHRAPDIRTAEAAKVIENIQRDINIALMNELALIFDRLGIDTQEVLRASRTKWNFLPFQPGLVGGHCIPVDPYYLTHKAEEVGYHPAVILAGRRINDSMGAFVAKQTIQLLARAGKRLQGSKVLVLGVTFKENVRDMRNSGVPDIIRELEAFGVDVIVHDPAVGASEIVKRGFRAVEDPFAAEGQYDGVVLAVAHETFAKRPLDAFLKLMRNDGGQDVLVDVKGVLPRPAPDQNVLFYRL